MLAHDFAAAERTLSDPTHGHCRPVGIITDPVALHRAMVAFLQGKFETAQRFAAPLPGGMTRNWTPTAS